MGISTQPPDDAHLRFAIIGFGIAGANFHAPIIASTPGCKVSGIVTSNEERKRKAQTEYPDVMVFNSAEELWARATEFDAVVIASPNRTHVPLAEIALRTGLAVVLDKPMAATAADCDRLVALSKETGSLMTVFQNRRWDGDFLTVKRLIETNTLGSITKLESHFDRWRPFVNPGSWREGDDPDQAGGLLFDLGSHLIDQAIYLFGAPLAVYAESHRRRPGAAVDDDTFVSLTFKDDKIAHLWVTNLAAIQAPRFRLYGTAGTYEKFGMDPQEEALKAGKRPATQAEWGADPQSNWGKLTREHDGLHFAGQLRTIAGNYVDFYRRFRAAIIEGAPVPVPPEEAALVIRTIEAAKRSSQEGQVIIFCI